MKVQEAATPQGAVFAAHSCENTGSLLLFQPNAACTEMQPAFHPQYQDQADQPFGSAFA